MVLPQHWAFSQLVATSATTAIRLWLRDKAMRAPRSTLHSKPCVSIFNSPTLPRPRGKMPSSGATTTCPPICILRAMHASRSSAFPRQPVTKGLRITAFPWLPGSTKIGLRDHVSPTPTGKTSTRSARLAFRSTKSFRVRVRKKRFIASGSKATIRAFVRSRISTVQAPMFAPTSNTTPGGPPVARPSGPNASHSLMYLPQSYQRPWSISLLEMRSSGARHIRWGARRMCSGKRMLPFIQRTADVFGAGQAASAGCQARQPAPRAMAWSCPPKSLTGTDVVSMLLRRGVLMQTVALQMAAELLQGHMHRR
mmetsp:Transcript_32715/g.73916  ORF Transcript_32715/g.73916 Transcript_32715/m.73916 type:complete len:310 (-) Transcript_32715:123-1052(-)